MNTYLAIDIGASSGRHIVGRLEHGKLNIKEVYRFKNGAERSGGVMKWNAERLFQEVVEGLKAAKKQGYEPQYIGIDTWAVDYALLNEKNEIIDDVYCYRDSRTISETLKVHKQISFEKLYGKTGIQFQPFNTVYQLYADKSSGRLKKAKYFLMLPDYLNYRLTGVMKQEYTNATSTGMVNAKTHEWDSEIIETLGFPNLFHELSQPGTVVGELKEEIAKQIGYGAKVILPATHDTASAVLAAPLDEENPYLSSGTWSLLGIEQPVAHTDGNSREANYSNEGSIGFGFRYQKNIMGLWILQNIRKEMKEQYSFAELSEMAKAATVVDTVDVNDNRFLSPENMTEEICKAVGKKLGTISLLRTVYESLAKNYAQAVEELERNTGKTYQYLHIIGGGSKDQLLNELTAKATGKTVVTGPVEATAIGNIVMQAIGAGELQNITDARNIIRNSFDIQEVKL